LQDLIIFDNIPDCAAHSDDFHPNMQSRLFTHTWQDGTISIIPDKTCFNV